MSEKIFNKYKKMWGAFWLFIFVFSNIFLVTPNTANAAAQYKSTNYPKPTVPFDVNSLKYEKRSGTSQDGTPIEYFSITTNKPDYKFIYSPSNTEKYQSVRQPFCTEDGFGTAADPQCDSTRGSVYTGDLLGVMNTPNHNIEEKQEIYHFYTTIKESTGPKSGDTVTWAIIVSGSATGDERSSGRLIYAIHNNTPDPNNVCGAVKMRVDWYYYESYQQVWPASGCNEIKYFDSGNDNGFSQAQNVTIKNPDDATGPIKTVDLIVKGAIGGNADASTLEGSTYTGFEELLSAIYGDAGTKITMFGQYGDTAEISVVKNITDINGKKAMRLEDTPMSQLRYPGKYSFNYLTMKNAANTTNPEASAAPWEQYTTEGQLSFNIDENKIVTIDTNDEFAKSSPINGKAIDSGLDFYLPVTVVKENIVEVDWFATAMNSAIKWILEGTNTGIQFVMGSVVANIDGANRAIDDTSVVNVLKGVRNTALGLLTLGLLIIAFANILGIDIEKYGINRMIPRMVIAVIGVFFSYLICKTLLDLSAALTLMLTKATNIRAASVTTNQQMINSAAQNTINQLTGSGTAQILFILLLFIGLLLICIWLWVILYVRVVVIIFLTCLAPAAFIMSIMPFTENLYKDWWKRFLTWTFMGPAIAFFLYAGNEFLLNGFAYEKVSASDISLFDERAWAFLILTAVCWGIAAVVPLRLGKDVYGKITGPAKKLGGMAMKGAGISQGINQAKASWAQKGNIRGAKLFDKWANPEKEGRLGKMMGFASGAHTDSQKTMARARVISEVAKELPQDKSGNSRFLAQAKDGSIEQKAALLNAAELGIDDNPITGGGDRIREIAVRASIKAGEDPLYLPGFKDKWDKGQGNETSQLATEYLALKDDVLRSKTTQEKEFIGKVIKAADKRIEKAKAEDWKKEDVIYASKRTNEGTGKNHLDEQLGNPQWVDSMLKNNKEVRKELVLAIKEGARLDKLRDEKQIRAIGTMIEASNEEVARALKNISSNQQNPPSTGQSSSGAGPNDSAML